MDRLAMVLRSGRDGIACATAGSIKVKYQEIVGLNRKMTMIMFGSHGELRTRPDKVLAAAIHDLEVHAVVRAIAVIAV